MRMDVWIEGRETPVGVLARAEDKTLSFTYAAGAANGGQISLSLPVRPEPYGDADCRGYFANLLFDGPQLDRVLSSFKVALAQPVDRESRIWLFPAAFAGHRELPLPKNVIRERPACGSIDPLR